MLEYVHDLPQTGFSLFKKDIEFVCESRRDWFC